MPIDNRHQNICVQKTATNAGLAQLINFTINGINGLFKTHCFQQAYSSA